MTSRSGVWKTRGFESFSHGNCGNAGQNLYVSHAGVLQRIYQYDLNQNGYIDLVFCNDHSHWETPPAYVYQDPLGSATCVELPAEGSKAGIVADLNSNGYDDLVLGMWHNGMRHDLNAYVYYGGADGWSERRQQFLPAPTCTSVTAGDFTGDGRQDLAFLCRPDLVWQQSGQLRLFYQTELGFEPKQSIDLPRIDGDTLAAEDLDDDGYCDLIVRTRNGQVRIFWGGPEGIDPARVALAPISLDPVRTEKVESSEEDAELYVPADEWLGKPSPLVHAVRLADVPHVCVAREQSVFLVPINPDRSFGSPVVLHCPKAIAVAAGDINGNGLQDLVVASVQPYQDAECSWIYWNNGRGYDENGRTPLQSLNVYDVVVGDLDGDGCDDIILCQGHTPESYTVDSLIYRGARNGVSDEPVRLVAHNPQRVFLARPSADEHLQVVFVNFRSGNLRGDITSSIYFGGPDGFSPDRRMDLPAWRPVEALCCDLNDDGFVDLLFASSYESERDSENPGSFVYLNGPDGLPDQPTWRLPVSAAHGVCCADINRNGYLDLIFCRIGKPELLLFYGKADGFDITKPARIRLEYGGVVYNEPRWIYLTDLNNNGWLDLVVPQVGQDHSLILWGGPDGFSTDRAQLLAMAGGGSCARAADLTGNGFLDLIVGTHAADFKGPHSSFVYIYWNSPKGLSADNHTVLPAKDVNAISVADFNNDGLLDLFVCSYHDGRERDIDSYVYWNRAGRGFSASDRTRLFTHSASGCFAADLNENGWIDLAIANHKIWGEHVGHSAVWWNGPDGFDEKRVTDLPTLGPHGITAIEPGNIVDRGPEEYYLSAPHELPAGSRVKEISWEAEVPPKTWVRAQLRCAESKEALDAAPWIGPTDEASWFENGQRADPTRFSSRWIQYRLALGATNSLRTPRVTAVNVLYDE